MALDLLMNVPKTPKNKSTGLLFVVVFLLVYSLGLVASLALERPIPQAFGILVDAGFAALGILVAQGLLAGSRIAKYAAYIILWGLFLSPVFIWPLILAFVAHPSSLPTPYLIQVLLNFAVLAASILSLWWLSGERSKEHFSHGWQA
jgi:hypothetical protein